MKFEAKAAMQMPSPTASANMKRWQPLV